MSFVLFSRYSIAMRLTPSHKAEQFWQRWQEILPASEYAEFVAAQNRGLPKTLRVNPLRNSVPQFLSWAHATHPDWQLEPHPFADHLFSIDRARRDLPLGNTIGHALGRFYLQEASSCLPPLALDPQPGETVLDLTAAPGSKSTQLAAMMQGRGLLVANELSASRIKKLVFNLIRCGVSNAVVTNLDGIRWGNLAPAFFDRILLDAPCTAEGTFRKDKKVLDHWSKAKIAEAAQLQERLLDSAFAALKPGGRLVYSTCTLAPEENERVVSRFLARCPDARLLHLRELFAGADRARAMTAFGNESFEGLDAALRVWPHLYDSEGFFVAALTKDLSATQSLSRSEKRERSRDDFLLKESEMRPIEAYLLSEWQLSIPAGFTVIKRPSEKQRIDYWLVAEQGIELLRRLRLQRPGIRLVETHGKQFVLQHDAAAAFGMVMSGPRVRELDLATTRRYLQKQDLAEDTPLSSVPGQHLLRYEGLPLGLAKALPGTLKNGLPPACAGEYF